ncbi:hypothetical protein ABPG77_001408 [Micractinium sp. CCAP 211/92]
MGSPLHSVDQRVAKLPADLRRRLLARAGIELDADGAVTLQAGQGEPAQQSHWGFPTNLPPRQQLVDLLERQQAAAEEAAATAARQDGQQPQQQQSQSGGQAWRTAGSARAPLGNPPEPAPQRPLLLELLQQSRTFRSPDCADAMAEALGVADLHRGLRGSLLGDTPPEATVLRTRGLLRAALRTAWSQEALRRGVALAKAGDLAGALPCYDQALQLDPGNADALVARGAALANRREWQRASDDLEAALQLQPQHSNAQLYLDAVQSKAAGAGVQLEPFGAGQRRNSDSAHANGAQEQEQQQRKQQTLSERHGRQPTAADAGGGEEQRQHGTRPGAPDSAGRRPPADSQRLGRGVGSVDPADGRSGRKRRRGSASASSSRSRSRGRGRRSRESTRSPGRRRGGSPASSSGGGSSGGSSSDSDAEAMAARLAEAQQRLQQPGGGEAAAGPEGLLGAGMDVATALQIVASHYKSRHGKEGKEDKRRRHKREGSKRHKHRHKKKHKKKRRH